MWPFKGRGPSTLEGRAHVFREKQETQDELGNIFLLVGLMAQYLFVVVSAVCWILTEPALGWVCALKSHSVEHLVVKTKYTRAEKELASAAAAPSKTPVSFSSQETPWL